MKNVLTASVVALVAATGAASAMTTSVTNGEASQIKRFAPDADLSNLSRSTVIHLLNTINDDGDDSFVQTQSHVRSILKNG